MFLLDLARRFESVLPARKVRFSTVVHVNTTDLVAASVRIGRKLKKHAPAPSARRRQGGAKISHLRMPTTHTRYVTRPSRQRPCATDRSRKCTPRNLYQRHSRPFTRSRTNLFLSFRESAASRTPYLGSFSREESETAGLLSPSERDRDVELGVGTSKSAQDGTLPPKWVDLADEVERILSAVKPKRTLSCTFSS